MLSIFKSDPIKKLQVAYERKLGEAMKAQRSGDIRSYSLLTAEAEDIALKIKAAKET